LEKNCGEVCIIHNTTGRSFSIQAHNHHITQLCLNEKATKLATASERGTKIRVYDTSTGAVLHEFTRGTIPATITSLAFNKHGSFLILTSDTGTIHIFSCESPETQSLLSWMMLGWAQQKSVSQFSIPKKLNTYVKALITKIDDKSLQITVLESTGFIYKYSHNGQVTTEVSRTDINQILKSKDFI